VPVLVRLVRLTLPLVDCAPLQAPEALQEDALVEDQVSVELLPETTDDGEAAMVTVGAGVVTVMVTDWLAVPPAPVQLKV